MVRALFIAAVATLVLAAPPAARAQPQPIPEGPGAGSIERFSGEAWTPRPLAAPDPPRHPHMAPNARSNLHVDAYQTDVHQGPGPLGRGTARSSTFHAQLCGSVTFDSKGRIVTVCVGLSQVMLRMIDPQTLATLAEMPLPPRRPSANPFQDFTGGGYFYLDERDRAVISTASRHVWVVAETDGPGFALERDFDLTGVVDDSDGIISSLPDWAGRIWFASRQGVVGTIDPASGRVQSIRIEPVGNSFAVDRDGAVFIVSDAALYRFEAGADGVPRPVWRAPYPNDGRVKPGQTQAGSGTTPTLIGSDRVAITDNADPIAVMVFERGRDSHRALCRQEVFERGAGSTDQSLIATPDLVVVENNHGYTGPAATEFGATTAPGLARVDLHPSGRGCRLAWTSQEVAPSVVPKLSAATGLVYTYTKPRREDDQDAWYLTALDVRTGRTVWSVLAGEGLGYNNNYAPITLGPDGTAYVGTTGGLVALRDAQPPGALRPAVHRRPRLRVSCAGRRVRVRVTGSGVLRVVVRTGRRRAGVDGRAPFDLRIRARRSAQLAATARLEGGSFATLRARAPRCSVRA